MNMRENSRVIHVVSIKLSRNVPWLIVIHVSLVTVTIKQLCQTIGVMNAHYTVHSRAEHRLKRRAVDAELKREQTNVWFGNLTYAVHVITSKLTGQMRSM